jgi:hypothetical protein
VEVGRIVEVMGTRRFEGGGNNEGGREDCAGRIEWCGASYTGSWNVTKFGAVVEVTDGRKV